VLASDPAADRAEVELLVAQGVRSALLVPVVAGGESIALIEAYSHQERTWSRREIRRARIVANHIGAVVERVLPDWAQRARLRPAA
jgi:GAF domain-containing protein